MAAKFPSITIRSLVLAAACAVAFLLDTAGPASSAPAGLTGTPVLLTFDVEADDDVSALRKLQLDVPATYFIAGRFVEDHPDVVRALAQDPRNTIGSHSYAHPDLTELDPEEARKDLLLAKLLLQETIGYAPRWFRAPFLKTSEDIIELLMDVGFTHDSSNRERWATNDPLFELPVSSGAGVLASDFDIFLTHRMSDQAALSWLIEQYEERAVLGRPFVILMHPRIIAEHATVLTGFMNHAARLGASFLGAEEYLRRTEHGAASSLGVWIDLSLGAHAPEQVAMDLRAAGISDAFLMASDPEGNRYFADSPAQVGAEHDVFGRILARLKAAGIRVHAWLPVFSDPSMARRRPELAMIDQSGAPSTQWLSPSHPEVREHVAATVRSLISNYDIDGIHLDYVRYPGLEYDYGSLAVQKFKSWAGLREVTVQALLTEHYNRWTDWRAQEITQFVADVRETIRQTATRDVVLSAALIADAAMNYRSLEGYGQSYTDLAAQLDWVMPMAYFQEDRRPVEWIRRVVGATRYRVGKTPILAGIEAYQKPGEWAFDKPLFERSLALARTGTEGVAFYPYLHLFGRGGDGADMPAGSLGVVAAFRAQGPDRRQPQR